MKSSFTTHCLVNLLDFVHRNLDKRDTSLTLVFINLKKSFDLVDHTVIIIIAIKLDIHPLLAAWLTGFISDRQQTVQFESVISALQHLTCGVPKDSKLGPLCFLILINDLFSASEHQWKYMDDSTVGIPISLIHSYQAVTTLPSSA